MARAHHDRVYHPATARDAGSHCCARATRIETRPRGPPGGYHPDPRAAKPFRRGAPRSLAEGGDGCPGEEQRRHCRVRWQRFGPVARTQQSPPENRGSASARETAHSRRDPGIVRRHPRSRAPDSKPSWSVRSERLARSGRRRRNRFARRSLTARVSGGPGIRSVTGCASRDAEILPDDAGTVRPWPRRAAR